jgi:Fe-S oxidoreductase
MVRAARAHFIENGVTDPEIYRALWVDHDYHVFKLYRRMQKIDEEYLDLLERKCDVLFFPGCALANESSDLVRLAVNWLACQGEEVALSLQCCGLPLAEMGLKERAENYTNRLWKKIGESGARRVVTSCPACDDKLTKSKMGGGIEVCSLFQLMAESGVKVPVIGSGRITLHDSCFDRKGKIGDYVRALLRDYNLKEMKHHGRENLCCGLGGVVSMVDPEICRERSLRRLQEMEETEADVCVTYCMSCAQRLANDAPGGKIRYILELVFYKMLDHRQYGEKVGSMWEGGWAAYHLNLLQNSKMLNQ